MAETNVRDWDRLPSGEIDIEPLAGFEVAGEPGNVWLRLEIVVGPGQIGVAQLAIPPDQASLLGEKLGEYARKAKNAVN